MDLVEEEDLEEMAVILGAKQQEEVVGKEGERRAEGNARVEGGPIVGLGIETGTPATPGVKLERLSEARSGEGRTQQLNEDLPKYKVNESLEVTECNVDSKKGEKDGVGRVNVEGEMVEKEENERKNSLRGRRMPAWVRRESMVWESSQRDIFGVEESLLQEEESLTGGSKEEVEVKSQNESLHSESFKMEGTGLQQEEKERGSKESESEETKEKGGKEGEGVKQGEEVTVATFLAWNEEEKEELDFCKVEEKLSEWRRRRKSGREEEEDRVR